MGDWANIPARKKQGCFYCNLTVSLTTNRRRMHPRKTLPCLCYSGRMCAWSSLLRGSRGSSLSVAAVTVKSCLLGQLMGRRCHPVPLSPCHPLRILTAGVVQQKDVVQSHVATSLLRDKGLKQNLCEHGQTQGLNGVESSCKHPSQAPRHSNFATEGHSRRGAGPKTGGV